MMHGKGEFKFTREGKERGDRYGENVVSAHACCRVSHREPMSNNNPYCDACAALALLSSEQSVSGNAGNSRERAPTITAI
jgi:hypothetical protein